jgi:hypothetical protein
MPFKILWLYFSLILKKEGSKGVLFVKCARRIKLVKKYLFVLAKTVFLSNNLRTCLILSMPVTILQLIIWQSHKNLMPKMLYYIIFIIIYNG